MSELETVEDYKNELLKALADVPYDLEGTYEDMYFTVYRNYKRLIRQVRTIINGKHIVVFNVDDA